MYALALQGKTSPDLLTTLSSSLTSQSFNPRGIDTHFTVVLLDTIRYTCRDLGFRKPSITIHRQKEEEMIQERMRYDQILQEAAAQQARETNKGKAREVVPDSEEELASSASEEW
ncbi:hypothetical protein PIB30_091724 [Stylosanthes scabra]|uniref:Uncharacterized protein n=1 Tax=Stylosanthes scabra TaxID=79078 RepID=A0ABU6VTD3_9FABA|nr:hypothetical protein [Stylosanthes scabra]